MFVIENNKVIKTRQTQKSTISQVIGNEKYVHESETESKRIYQWMKFDLESERYWVDTTNTDSIMVDGVEYTPTDGKVEIEIDIESA